MRLSGGSYILLNRTFHAGHSTDRRATANQGANGISGSTTRSLDTDLICAINPSQSRSSSTGSLLNSQTVTRTVMRLRSQSRSAGLSVARSPFRLNPGVTGRDGTVGGQNSDYGPHLHFEIRGENQVALDPTEWLRKR